MGIFTLQKKTAISHKILSMIGVLIFSLTLLVVGVSVDICFGAEQMSGDMAVVHQPLPGKGHAVPCHCPLFPQTSVCFSNGCHLPELQDVLFTSSQNEPHFPDNIAQVAEDNILPTPPLPKESIWQLSAEIPTNFIPIYLQHQTFLC